MVLALALLSLLAGSETSEAQIAAWAKSYGMAGNEVAWAVNPTSDGGCVTAGWRQTSDGWPPDLWVLKLDVDGGIQWQKAFGGTYDEDNAEMIQETADGGYILAGYTQSYGAGGTDAWLLKLDSDGAVEWQKAFGGSKDDQVVSVQQTADGGYVLAGETTSYGAGDWDLWVLKLDADGVIDWQKTYGGPKSDTSSADPIEQTPDGGYIVTGRTRSFGAGDYDVWVLKLDAAGGVAWQKTYGGQGRDEGHAVRRTRDGGYAVGAFTWSFGAGVVDVWLLKLDPSGAIQWQKTLGGAEWDMAWTIWPTSDGGCVTAAETDSFGAGEWDFWVIKLDPEGDVQWHRTFGGPEDETAVCVRQTDDGGYLAAGGTASFGTGGYDFWILKLDWNGTIPGCDLSTTPAAIVADTQVTGAASQATVQSAGAQAQTTHDTPLDTGAPATIQCLAEIDCLGPVRITRTPLCYFPALSGAWETAVDGETIQARALTFTGDLVLDQPKTVALSGGYDCMYDLAADNTRIEGTVTVRRGTLKLGHIAIRP